MQAMNYFHHANDYWTFTDGGCPSPPTPGAFVLCTVSFTFHANHADNLTRSPYHFVIRLAPPHQLLRQGLFFSATRVVVSRTSASAAPRTSLPATRSRGPRRIAARTAARCQRVLRGRGGNTSTRNLETTRAIRRHKRLRNRRVTARRIAMLRTASRTTLQGSARSWTSGACRAAANPGRRALRLDTTTPALAVRRTTLCGRAARQVRMAIRLSMDMKTRSLKARCWTPSTRTKSVPASLRSSCFGRRTSSTHRWR